MLLSRKLRGKIDSKTNFLCYTSAVRAVREKSVEISDTAMDPSELFPPKERPAEEKMLDAFRCTKFRAIAVLH